VVQRRREQRRGAAAQAAGSWRQRGCEVMAVRPRAARVRRGNGAATAAREDSDGAEERRRHRGEQRRDSGDTEERRQRGGEQRRVGKKI
jgi:hypothetical protein